MAKGKRSRPSRESNPRSRRWKAAALAAVIVALGWGVQLLWQRVSPHIVRRERYLLPAEAIQVTPPPAWINADVREQVIHAANLDRRLSILDDNFVQALQDAFALHPWVESIKRIEKKFPPAVLIDLLYRRPVAVVEIVAGGTVHLLPVDQHGIHLPGEDVPEIRRRYLPRIGGIVGQPPIGGRWDDPRVDGAVELACRLADQWDALHLVEILPSARPEINGPRRYFVYDLATRGGTRIVWGAAPMDCPPGEADFEEKLARLQQCVRELGPLNSVRGPAVVDVRRELHVTPRTARLFRWPDPAEIQSLAGRVYDSLRAAAARLRLAAQPEPALR